MINPHHHACISCGHRWKCELPVKPRQKVCPVDAARKVNGAGPYCVLCRALNEAAQAAAIRGMSVVDVITIYNTLRREISGSLPLQLTETEP